MSESGDAYESPPDGFPIAPVAYACPGCGHSVPAVPGPVARLVDCPACQERFLIPSETGSTEIPDETEAPEEQERRKESELNSLRMRHVVVTRRTAMRSRTYALLGAISCLIGAIKLVLMTIAEVRVVGWHMRQLSFVMFVIAGLIGVAYFMGRAAHWARESQATGVPDPESPPDFTTLSDGSQHARNLEDLK